MQDRYVHQITTKKDLCNNIDCLVKSYALPEVPPAFCQDVKLINNYIHAITPLLEDLCEEVNPVNTTCKPKYSNKFSLLISELMLYFASTAVEFINDKPKETIELFKNTIINAMLISDKMSDNRTSLLSNISFILKTDENTSMLANLHNEYIERASLSNLECVYNEIAETWFDFDTLSNLNLQNKPSSSRRLIFETLVNATDAMFNFNMDGSGVTYDSLKDQMNFYKYLNREWPLIQPVSLVTETQVLKKHAQLSKLINKNFDFEPGLKNKVSELMHISKLVARNILGSSYDSSMHTAHSLDLEESDEFWTSACLNIIIDDSTEQKNIESLFH